MKSGFVLLLFLSFYLLFCFTLVASDSDYDAKKAETKELLRLGKKKVQQGPSWDGVSWVVKLKGGVNAEAFISSIGATISMNLGDQLFAIKQLSSTNNFNQILSSHTEEVEAFEKDYSVPMKSHRLSFSLEDEDFRKALLARDVDRQTLLREDLQRLEEGEEESRESFRMRQEFTRGEELREELESLTRERRQTATEKLLQQLTSNPLFTQQWALKNIGQNGGVIGEDINVVDVWSQGYTGLGVRVAVADDGFDLQHPEFAGRWSAATSWDFIDKVADPSAKLTDDNHGTATASLVGASHNNVCGVGVAWNCTFSFLRMLGNFISASMITGSLTYKNDSNDIYSNSWGVGTIFSSLGSTTSLNSIPRTLQKVATSGRGGKGNIYVFSAGNEGDSYGNTNDDFLVNNPWVITVAASNRFARYATYSSPGASVFVAAPSGGLVTADRLGSAGYSNGDCYSSFSGTSGSAPIVSGVIALLLQANPSLTARDVQHILSRSSDQIDSDTDSSRWQKNAGGFMVSHDYGFGRVNALRALNLALGWQTVPPIQNFTVPGPGFFLSIPPSASETTRRLTVQVTTDLKLEWVRVTVDITHNFRGDLSLVLTSPGGTQSRLKNPNPNDAGTELTWTFGTVMHWGESSLGTWVFEISDTSATDQGTLNSWSLTFYGVSPSSTNAPTPAPTTSAPTTPSPTTASPSTASPSTASPTTASPTTTRAPTTASPTTASPTTTRAPTTSSPTTRTPTTASPSTASPSPTSDSNSSPTPTTPTNSTNSTNSTDSNACCVSQKTPSCPDLNVSSKCVCKYDKYCCGVRWDSTCVKEVSLLSCGSCKNGIYSPPPPPKTTLPPTPPPPSNISCCTPHLSPGCVTSAVQSCVCNKDSYCCDNQWDKACVKWAQTLCGPCSNETTTTPPPSPTPTPFTSVTLPFNSTCCKSGKGKGCDNGKVQGCVCSTDPYCCSTKWDSDCVKNLGKCAVCEAPPTTPAPTQFNSTGKSFNGSCCKGKSDPGCENSNVMSCVCNVDSFCCTQKWDSLCVLESLLMGCNKCNFSPTPSKNETNSTTPPPFTLPPEYQKSCCLNKDVAGCGNSTVQSCVCARDSYCCKKKWDAQCVKEAWSWGCGTCPDYQLTTNSNTTQSPNNTCCESSSSPQCSNSQINLCVCSADPSCCNVKWDFTCVERAQKVCGAPCGLTEWTLPAPTTPPPSNSTTHNCCKVHQTVGCTNSQIQSCVCKEDGYCCTKKWDTTCINRAKSSCGSCN